MIRAAVIVTLIFAALCVAALELCANLYSVSDIGTSFVSGAAVYSNAITTGYVNKTPDMTSMTDPYCVITEAGPYNQPAWKMFDKDMSTYYEQGWNTGEQIDFMFTNDMTITRYSIVLGADAGSGTVPPDNWTVYGLTAGGSPDWTLDDQFSHSGNLSWDSTNSFTIASPVSCRGIRILFYSNIARTTVHEMWYEAQESTTNAIITGITVLQ
jgi:hypothetical protein